MNTKFQLQIGVHNYDGTSHSYNNEITLNDLSKFAGLLETMKKNIDHTTWNWFQYLPSDWDGRTYAFDEREMRRKFEEYWGFDYSELSNDKMGTANFIKEFFLRFTPDGADRIESINVYKLEEIL